MFNVKKLAPGRVLCCTSTLTYRDTFTHEWMTKTRRDLCMVIGFVPDIKRRHAKKSAPSKGLKVMVVWMTDDRRCKVEELFIQTDNIAWKRDVGWSFAF